MSLLLLGAFVARALQTRWVADDFCVAAMVDERGFWGAQVDTYREWSGRYASTFIGSALIAMGERFAPVSAIALLAIWLTCAWQFARRLFLVFRLRTTQLDAIAAAAAVVSACIYTSPDTFQTLLWTTGIAAYGLAAAGVTHMASQFLQPSTSPRALLLIAAEAAVLGGFAETVLVCIVAMSVALLCLAPTRRMAAAALCGALVALVIVLFAPGNPKRSRHFEGHPARMAFLESAAAVPSELRLVTTRAGGWMLLLVVAFAAGSPAGGARVSRTRMAGVAFLVLTTFGIAAAGYWAIGTRPPPRAHLPAIVALAGSVAVIAASLRRGFHARHGQWIATALLALGFVTGPLEPILSHPSELREARAFRTGADSLARTARLHPGKRLVVDAPRQYALLDYLSEDPRYWTNDCMARHYDLVSIADR